MTSPVKTEKKPKLDLASLSLSNAFCHLKRPVEDLVYCPETREMEALWAKRQQLNSYMLQTARVDKAYQVVVAPEPFFNPAKCRSCGEQIDVGELRFAYFTAGGTTGAAPHWFHIPCTPLKFLGFDTMASILPKCAGLDKLKEHEKMVLKEKDCFFNEPRPVVRRRYSQPLTSRAATESPQVEIPQGLATLSAKEQGGLAWLVNQETSSAQGGIFADSERRRKTLQFIGLILLRRELVKTTLIVCPVNTVLEWYTDFDRFVYPDHKLTVLIYEGSQTAVLLSDLLKYDVVLTTYKALESTHCDKENASGGNVLQRVSWGRVILDDPAGVAGQSESVMILKAEQSRFVMTEAPVDNRVDHLFGLLQFLRLDPFGLSFCQEQDCKCKTREVDFREGRCVQCGHTQVCHTSQMREQVINPIVRDPCTMEAYDAQNTLDKKVLEVAMLQRIEDIRIEQDEFARNSFSGPRTVRVRPLILPDLRNSRVPLSGADLAEHFNLLADAQREFRDYVKTDTIMANYARIFNLLTQLREITPATCDAESSCVMCGDQIATEDRTAGSKSCTHIFHQSCLDAYIESAPEMAQGGVGCPVCMTRFEDLTPSEQEFPAEEPAAKKAKIEDGSECGKLDMLVKECNEFLDKDETSKILVFSQFSRMLSKAQDRLSKEARFSRSARLVRDMTLEETKNVIDEFNRNPDLKVLFVLLRPRFLRFTVKSANRVVLLEPSWSADLEMQALMTAGSVTSHYNQCVRLVCQDTIEERIVDLRKSRAPSATRRQSLRPLEWLTAKHLMRLFKVWPFRL